MMLSAYFKQRPGFQRLFLKLRKKFQSLGHYSGTVVLENISQEEARDLSAFFGYHVLEGGTFKTSFREIEKKLKQTKYQDFTWSELMEDYFGQPLLSNREKHQQKEEEIRHYFSCLKEKMPSSIQPFFEQILKEKTPLYQTILKRYHKEKEKLQMDLLILFSLLDQLPRLVPTTLPMLASFSGNPHFLDLKMQNSTLFIKLLALKMNEAEPKTTMEKILFLSKHQIYVDSLSNYVITYKLFSERSLITAFAEEKEVLNLNLSNVETTKTLDTKEKKVVVFENPSMAVAFKSYDLPMVITSGMPNYVVYLVLEKLIQSGNQLYYNGDFDPEGLIIAEKLKKAFPTIQFFCYESLDYQEAKSKEKLSKSRLQKLRQVTSEEFFAIKELLKKEGCAGYQEKNQKRLVEFLENNLC